MTLAPVFAAAACQDCGKCTSVCPVARTGFGFSPRRLLRTALECGLETALADRSLFACLGCDRCAGVCMSGLSITSLVRELRQLALSRNAAGTPAHSGVLQSVMRLMASSPEPQNPLDWLDQSVRVNERGSVLYFVGCAPYFDLVFSYLGVRLLNTTRNAIRLLNRLGIEPCVLPDERCCGHDLLWSGDRAGFIRLAERNAALLRQSGADTVVFSCPECLRTLKLDYPAVAPLPDLRLLHITEFLATRGEGRLNPSPRPERVTFHDPCRLGRHLGVFDAPRQVLASIPELDLVEMAHNRATATCCGGTCWVECGAAVKCLQGLRLAEARATHADRLITACPKCAIHFACSQDTPSARTSAGPDFAVLDIVDLLAESLG